MIFQKKTGALFCFVRVFIFAFVIPNAERSFKRDATKITWIWNYFILHWSSQSLLDCDMTPENVTIKKFKVTTRLSLLIEIIIQKFKKGKATTFLNNISFFLLHI